MSKTPKATSRISRKRSPVVRVPIGLSAAFKMIAAAEETASSPDTSSAETYPHAVRIIDHLFGRGGTNSDVELEENLAAATRAMFGTAHEDSAESVSCVSQASFRVGFAVCWLLMAQVHGGAASALDPRPH